MKKFFTLISVALFAMSANTQTTIPDDEYIVIDDEKHYAPEFEEVIDGVYQEDKQAYTSTKVKADKIVNGQSVVTISGPIVTVTSVSNGTPQDLLKSDGYTETQTFDNTNWPLWSDPEWKVFNKNKKVWHWEGEGDSKQQVTDFTFFAIQGTANPVTGFKSKVVTTDDVFSKLTADYDGYYFVPGTSTAVPASGEYFTFKANADGMFRVGFAVASGTNRYMYIVRKSDVYTLLPSEYKVEGYVNAKDNQDGSPAWQASIMVNADRTIGNVNGTTWKDNAEQTLNEVSREKFGWFVFNAKANETYYIFTPNTQFGFRSYEFYKDQTIDDYTPKDPTGIIAIKDDVTNAVNVNAPVYNLAGQKVNANAKGLLIKNGKKFMNK